ncbi:hypothetical protein ABID59_004376 [Bradyrhizobium sp. S3.3.6]
MAIAMLEKPFDLASGFDAQRVGVRGIEGSAVVGVLVEEKHGLWLSCSSVALCMEYFIHDDISGAFWVILKQRLGIARAFATTRFSIDDPLTTIEQSSQKPAARARYQRVWRSATWEGRGTVHCLLLQKISSSSRNSAPARTPSATGS